MVRRVGVLAVLVLVVAALGFGGGPVGAVLPWAVLGYMGWRACPGVVADLRWLGGRLPVGRRGRLRVPAGRGERL